MTPSPPKLPISTSPPISIKHKIPIWLLLKREGREGQNAIHGEGPFNISQSTDVSRVAIKNKTMNP